MSDETIKAALREAGEAVRKSMIKPPCCMEGTGCELPPCHCSQVAAAAAVAAFLRACPVMGDLSPGADKKCFLDEWAREDWAAAVERAALDTADGR